MLVNLPSPHLGALAHPSTLEMLQAREHALIPSPYVVFTFGLAIESIKEFGGASITIQGNNIIRTILVTKKLGALTKHPKN